MLKRRVPVALLLAVLTLLLGSAVSRAATKTGPGATPAASPPQPDPAPSAIQHQRATSTGAASGGGAPAASSPAPAPTPVVTPTPPAATQVTAPPAKPKARAATTHRVVPHSKARPEKKKAVVHTKVVVKKPAVKPAVRTRNPVVETGKPGAFLPVVLPNPALVNPVVPAGGRDSSWNLSDGDILLIAILLSLAVALLAWAGWRLLRFQWWGWHYNVGHSWDDSEALEDVQTRSNHG